MTITNFFKDKSVLILGFGLEGRSTLKLLKSLSCDIKKIGIADINPIETEVQDCEIYSGEDYLSAIDKFDIAMKAPGIALLDKINDEQKRKITSQTDLLLRFSDNTIIGITGTKGKSTTSSLIHHILTSCGKKSALIGNIGVPPLESLFNYDIETLLICEMSCHQLEYVQASPDIAVLLNIYEEHLDHYIDFNAYKSAKENIFRYQDESDLLFYNAELNQINNSLAEKISCSYDYNMECDVYVDVKNNVIDVLGIKIPFHHISTYLPGIHNMYNIAVAIAVCMHLECPLDEVLKAVATFKGLPHRLEYIGKVNGAEYINDSISTIPRAVISAIKAFPDTDSVIIGGMDRGINYDELVVFINSSEHNLKKIILLPDSGYRIAKDIMNKKSVYLAKDMEDAVRHSNDVTKVRCILSPAAASYGFYKNFEERGEHFKSLVASLG